MGAGSTFSRGKNRYSEAMRHLLGILLALAILLVAAWSAASLLAEGNTSDAGPRSRLDSAILLSPANAEYYKIKSFRALTKASGPGAQAHREAAEQNLLRASRLAPSWEKPILDLANLCAGSLRMADAPGARGCQELYLAALSRNPTYGYAHYRYGDFLHQLQVTGVSSLGSDLGQVCGQYHRALRLIRPTLGYTPWYKQAESQAFANCAGQAPDYAHAKILAPDTPRQWYLMGLHLGRKGAATWQGDRLEIYKDLAKSDERDDSCTSLAKGFDHGGLPEAGIAVIRHFLVNQPREPELWIALLKIMTRHHDVYRGPEIMTNIEKAAALCHFQPQDFLSLGRWACRYGDPQLADTLFQKAVSGSPSDPAAFAAWGKCLLESGRAAQAIKAYRKAVTMAPDSAEYHLSLGKALAQNHQFEPAIDEINRALSIDPNNKAAIDFLRSKGIY